MAKGIETIDEGHWSIAEDIYSAENVRGSYSPSRFVVRLSPDVHAELNANPSGFLSARTIGLPHLSAFATYFHETIHWWQHIGSTTGLMLSLAYPAQCHVNRPHLLKLLKEIGPKKSLRTLLEKDETGTSAEAQNRLNIVVNNWHDCEFNSRIIIDPLRHMEPIVNNPYFDCVGHSLVVGLTHALWLLTATFDREVKYFPDFRRWEAHFDELRTNKVNGFYFGSPVKRPPVGALHIFEGQARFCQLQYLHLTTGGSMSWDEFAREGMMEGVYVQAFERFLQLAKRERPPSPIDLTVQLFLLVCDLAMNPSDGYPFDLYHFESFIESTDPGHRFYWFSSQIAKSKSLQSAIIGCTRNEYLEVATTLTRSLVCQQPVEVAEKIVGLPHKEWALS